MPTTRRRKFFGQHFLRDDRVIARIVEETFAACEKHGARALLEVGPGMGAITNPLLNEFAARPDLERMLIIEKDRRLAEKWVEDTQSLGRVKVVSEDFLKVPLAEIVEPHPLVVVSNLPYSVGTAIMTELATEYRKIPAMVLMFQAEVANRLHAKVGTKSWGSLSLWVQNRWDVTKVCAVPPGAFMPPPDVNSEVVLLTARAEPRIRFAPEHEKDWEKLLKTSFLHRRKMLRSGLPKNSPMSAALLTSGIDPELRAEALTWEQWQAFMTAYEKIAR